jgi:hypothetical protein
MRGIAAYNAGVGGMSSFDAFHLLRDHLPDSGSKTVVLGFYLGNDFRDNYHGGIFEPEQTPSQPTGADTRSFKARAFDVTCGISAVCRKLYQQIWLGYVRGQATDPMASYPLSEIVMLRAADARADVAVAKTRTALTSLNELIAGRGGRLVVLGIPSRAQVLRSFKELSRFAEEPRAREFAEDTFRGNFSWDRPNELLAGLCAELAVEYVSLAAMAAREAVSKKPFDE